MLNKYTAQDFMKTLVTQNEVKDKPWRKNSDVVTRVNSGTSSLMTHKMMNINAVAIKAAHVNISIVMC